MVHPRRSRSTIGIANAAYLGLATTETNICNGKGPVKSWSTRRRKKKNNNNKTDGQRVAWYVESWWAKWSLTTSSRLNASGIHSESRVRALVHHHRHFNATRQNIRAEMLTTIDDKWLLDFNGKTHHSSAALQHFSLTPISIWFSRTSMPNPLNKKETWWFLKLNFVLFNVLKFRLYMRDTWGF